MLVTSASPGTWERCRVLGSEPMHSGHSPRHPEVSRSDRTQEAPLGASLQWVLGPRGDDTCSEMPWWEGGKRDSDLCATGHLCFPPADTHGGCAETGRCRWWLHGDRGRDLGPLCCLHLCSALKTQYLNSRSKAGSRPGSSLGSLEGGLRAALCAGLLVSWGVRESS